MSRRAPRLPLQFSDYQRFGITADFIKYILNIGWTIHRNEIVASQLVIAAFLYLQSRVAQLEGRKRKRVGKATKIFLDHPQMIQKLVFELSEKHEIAQEETQICDISTLLIRYIKNLVSFYMEYNSYYVVVGQTRYLLEYAPRHLEVLDRKVAPNLMRGGDKQLGRVQKQIYEELERRFKDQLKRSTDGRRKYAFELLKQPDQFVNLVKETLSRFNIWIYPKSLRQDRLDPNKHKDMGQAEIDRYHTLLDFNALMDLIGRLSLPEPQNCWALPDFCLASSENPPSDLNLPAWTDEELQAIEDTITVTLARRQSASARRLSVLIDGKERCSFSPQQTESISFDLNQGDKLIEVISREPDGDLPLAAYLMDYDEESYGKRWRYFGERQLKSVIILEGGQKVSFNISLTKNAEQEATGARITLCFQPSSQVAQWWERFHLRNWQLSILLHSIPILASPARRFHHFGNLRRSPDELSGRDESPDSQ